MKRCGQAIAAASAACSIVAAASPPCFPTAVSRDDVMDIFAEHLLTDTNIDDLEAYIPPCPLMPGDTLGEYLGDAPMVISTPTWLVFIDDQPMANFEHPVRYMLIDANTGAMIDEMDLLNPPVINGEPQYHTPQARENDDRITDGHSVMPDGPVAVFNAPAAAAAPAPTVWGIVVGGAADKRHKEGVDKARQGLKKKPGIPDEKLKSKKCATKQDFCDLIKEAKNCDKVYLVITSHGSDTERNNVKPWRIQFSDGWMNVEDMIKKMKEANVKKWCIMAETCYSGCLITKARGQIDAEIATASSESKTSNAWTWTRRDTGEVTKDINHYSEEFWKCWTDDTKEADKAANGGDGNGDVSWEEAHKWAKKKIETPSGTAGDPGSGPEKQQDPQYEKTYVLDTFFWSGGTGTSGGQGCTKLDLYNPSCTETRQIDWEITLPPRPPSGDQYLDGTDGVTIVDTMGTETLKPKEKKTIKIRFNFPVLPNGGTILPKATVKEHGTTKVLGCDLGCVEVAAPAQPTIDQRSNSAFLPESDTTQFTVLQFAVQAPPSLIGIPLQFHAQAMNTNPHDERPPFSVFPPNVTRIFNSPSQTHIINLQVFVPPDGFAARTCEIFLTHIAGGNPGNFATLGVTMMAPATDAVDCNNNGIPDVDELTRGVETDCDNNGRLDECELFFRDCDMNGRVDACDIAMGAPDTNGDGIPDTCQDCDGNLVPDPVQIAVGALDDCNGDGIADLCDPGSDCNGSGRSDYCDLMLGTSRDCNLNNRPDECDIASGLSMDLNFDGVPDECQDCNDNGQQDPLDILSDLSDDCNANGVPDECELESHDYNQNGVPDDCDIANGTSMDCDGNGYPDDAQLDELDCNHNGRLDPCDVALGVLHDVDRDGLPDECELMMGETRVLAGDVDNCASQGGPADTLVLRPMFSQFLARPNGPNAMFHGGQPQPFDQPAPSQWAFGYSFLGLPNDIQDASLTIHMKAGPSGAADDGLSLQFFRPPPSFVWSIFISDLDAFQDDGAWSAGESRTFTLDLRNLPNVNHPPLVAGPDTNLIPRLNADGFLDVYVQSDSGVDFLDLRIHRTMARAGACCVDHCTCEILVETECLAQGGTYHGDGTLCFGGLCGSSDCPCDWNGVDGLDSQDYFDFLSDFFDGRADFNCDHAADSQDFFEFLSCFFIGSDACL